MAAETTVMAVKVRRQTQRGLEHTVRHSVFHVDKVREEHILWRRCCRSQCHVGLLLGIGCWCRPATAPAWLAVLAACGFVFSCCLFPRWMAPMEPPPDPEKPAVEITGGDKTETFINSWD